MNLAIFFCLGEPASVFRTVMFYGNKLYVFKTYNCVPLYWHKVATFKLVELIGMQN